MKSGKIKRQMVLCVAMQVLALRIILLLPHLATATVSNFQYTEVGLPNNSFTSKTHLQNNIIIIIIMLIRYAVKFIVLQNSIVKLNDAICYY